MYHVIYKWIFIFSPILALLLGQSIASVDQIVTLQGSGFITYAISGGSIVSGVDETSLEFRTQFNTSFLFYTGNRLQHDDTRLYHILIYLSGGRIILRIFHGGSQEFFKEVKCHGARSNCADNRWHSITVARQAEMPTDSDQGWLLIGITVDGRRLEDAKQTSIRRHLTSRTMFLGGYREASEVGLTKSLPNFKGCIRQATYKADNILLNILALAKENNHQIKAVGDVQFHSSCLMGSSGGDISLESVTFTTPGSYMVVPGWSQVSQGRLEFAFRTTEPNGLLLYQHADQNLDKTIPMESGSSSARKRVDFIAFELRDAGLYFVINTGGGTYRSFVAQGNLADGKRHFVVITISEGHIKIQLDGKERLSKPHNSYSFLNVNGKLYVGGIPLLPQRRRDNTAFYLPYEIWSGVLGRGYVGCLGDLKIDGAAIELMASLEDGQSVYGTDGRLGIDEVIPGCEGGPGSQKAVCSNRPCHDGICSPGWNRFLCDCFGTNFTGKTCTETAPVVQFNGFQFMRIQLKEGSMQTESEDLRLRFLTGRSEGLLLRTKSPASVAEDRLELRIVRGNIVVLFNFGIKTERFETLTNVNDNKWHTLTLQRRERQLTVTIDQNKFSFDITSSAKLLSHNSITVGTSPGILLDTATIPKKDNRKWAVEDYFVGHMMHFSFNGINYFELANSAESPDNIEVTATLDNAEHIKQFPMYFATTNSYIQLPPIGIFGDFRLEFWFKTWQSSGMLALLDGSDSGGDFLILELFNNHLHLIFNWGSGTQQKVSVVGGLNDSKWHRVQLVRVQSNSRSMAFRVDGWPRGRAADIPVNPGGINFNKMGHLYLGGTRESVRQKIQSKPTGGFQGCIASFYINKTETEEDLLTDLDNMASPPINFNEPINIQNPFQLQVESVNVTSGCPNPKIQCFSEYCHYGGRCIQQWRRLRCDCKRTTFVGPNCTDVGSTLRFGDPPGFMVYEINPLLNTTRDEITMGVQTVHKSSAALLSLYGIGKTPDYIKISIVLDTGRCILQVRYNMGSASHSLHERAVDLADGRYHVIRFTRDGPNAFLRVDDLPTRERKPVGHQSSHFNQQKTILLGQSSWILTQRVKRYTDDLLQASYTGYITGLVLNDFPLIDIEKGETVPGIRRVNKSNVWIEPNFKPNLDGFPPQPRRSETNVRMQSTPRSHGPINKDSKGLVIPRPGCPDPFNSQSSLGCESVDSNGIIRPNIEIKTTPKYPLDPFKLPYYPVFKPQPSNDQTLPALKPGFDDGSNGGTRSIVGPSRIDPKTGQPIENGQVTLPISINLWLVVAISSSGAAILIVLSCIIYRCRRKDEGSYDVEENHNFVDPATRPLRENHYDSHIALSNGSSIRDSGISNGNGRGSLRKTSKNRSGKRKKGDKSEKSKESKEWYV